MGDPGLPAVKGKETAAELIWRYNGQDSPDRSRRAGVATTARMLYVFDGPNIDPPLPTERSSVGLTQFETRGSYFRPVRTDNRLFTAWGFGTSFDNSPLMLQQFHMGQPFRLGAYNLGELKGDHYYLATVGYLHQLGRLPDFLGGPIFVGGWLENGDAFDDFNKAASARRPASASSPIRSSAPCCSAAPRDSTAGGPRTSPSAGLFNW